MSPDRALRSGPAGHGSIPFPIPYPFPNRRVGIGIVNEIGIVSRLLESRIMARRLSLFFLAIASPVMLVLFFLPWGWAQSLFAVLVMGYPVALIVFAVGGRRPLGPLGPPLLALLVFLELCVVGMLVLRGQVLDGPWFGGLPAAAAIQLYGVFLAPLLLVALAYALTFDRTELRQEDLDRLRDRTRRPEPPE